MQLFDRFWHQQLRRPYYLSARTDVGNGPTVVLLHGIGRTGEVWKNLIVALAEDPVRVVAFDLMGFGESPKPTWPDYDVDDHVKTVIKSIERLKLGAPIILVGHSMGCLVAVRLARQRPDLVKHLVLYEMPLYKGLPNKGLYRLRLNFYFRMYRWAVNYQPSFNDSNPKFAERIAKNVFELEIGKTSWVPFVKSLEHTILEQTAPEDIPLLKVPMDVIYGSFDMLVIRGTVTHVIDADAKQLQLHTVRAGHRVTRRASQLLRERILSAIADSPSKPKNIVQDR